jgi:branched-chain amino acid transport system ATP-binding protein
MSARLEVDRVSKSFGGVAANVDISFDVKDGEILGLIGPNGAGKTTLFSFDSMSVLENVMVGAFARHGRARAAMTRALDVLEFTGLAARADTQARSLSPAEKRRLEVARALATEPKLLLLDEMLTGLTPTEAQTGVALIRAVRDRGITVIMVEHVMEVLLPLIDRAVVLNLGRVLTTGLPAEVVRNPEVIRAYLGDRYAAA